MTSLSESHIYYGEKCNGMVTARFWVDGDRKVNAHYDDGDISSHTVTYELKKVYGTYGIVKRSSLHTHLDGQFGKNPDERNFDSLDVKDEREALIAFIDSIVEPHLNPGEYAFPVNAKKLKKGLEKVLLTEPAFK
ncbi:MAG: hypothetical protein ABIB79_03525 [archaeon]